MTSPTSALDVRHRDLRVPLPEGGDLAARLYQPVPSPSPAAATPLVLHFHGGAFTAGDVCSGACVASLLARAGAVVVSLDYPLSPAAPFPAPVEAGHAALRWLARQRRRLAGAASRLWLAGEEAGGNVAAAVALRSRDAGEPELAGQVLLSPMLDACVATASLRAAHAGGAGCRYAEGWRRYLSKPDDVLHPYATPGSAVRLAGLPPTLVISAPDDPMRDEAEAWVARLQASGVAAGFAQLACSTGWPESYGRPPAPPPVGSWAERVLALVRPFFADPLSVARASTPMAPSPTTASSRTLR